MAKTSITRRLQWMDTDAAGIWHHSVVLRWAEEAEAELHRTLGISQFTFGATPRVQTEFSFSSSMRFDEEVEITLTVSTVGETSTTYDITYVSDGKQIATGRLVAVFIDRETGEKQPWPAHIRESLES